MNKEIQKGAIQYAEFITDYIPQTENEKVKYYFSGSLAMLLFSTAKSIKMLESQENGEITKVLPEKIVDTKASEAFAKGIRPITSDIDIVQIADKYLNDKTYFYNLEMVKEHCDLATTLCPTWGRSIGTMYFDVLSKDRNITNHNIAVIETQKGNKIITIDPVDLMIHKVSELLYLNLERYKAKEKYEKDIKDFACLFNGVGRLNLLPENLTSHLQSMINSNTRSGVNFLQNKDVSERLKKALKDILPYIEPELHEEFNKFLGEIKTFNQYELANAKE